MNKTVAADNASVTLRITPFWVRAIVVAAFAIVAVYAYSVGRHHGATVIERAPFVVAAECNLLSKVSADAQRAGHRETVRDLHAAYAERCR